MTDGFVPFSQKTDVKVHLWVTTRDGKNRSTWFKRLSFCKSNPCMLPPPLLWLCSRIMNISWQASNTMPRKIFQGFFLIETLGLESVTEAWSKSEAPRRRIGFMMHRLMTSGGYFLFLRGEPLCPPRLINHWAVCCHFSKDLSVAFCWVEKWFQSALSASCVLTNCDRFPHLISVELEWLSRGESAWISSVLNAAFSILHCPLAFSWWDLSCFCLCQV